MTLWKPDATFYPSPRMAMEAPAEKIAYVAGLNCGRNDKPDALLVVDVDPESKTYGEEVGRLEMPVAGDELHHFGWNACSSRSEEHTSELQSLRHLVCRLLLEKKNAKEY